MADECGLAVALTGGIACGKSTVSGFLEEAGWPVLDTDRVAHSLMETGTAVYQQIVKHFGSGILHDDRSIDRKQLGRIVFKDDRERSTLNRLVHPAVHEVWTSWLYEQRSEQPVAVVVIPLLFEVGLKDGWDAIVCVTAEEEVMMGRLQKRGLDREAAQQRIDAQMPVAEKAKRSDFVIENNGTLKDLKMKTKNVMRKILTKENSHGGS